MPALEAGPGALQAAPRVAGGAGQPAEAGEGDRQVEAGQRVAQALPDRKREEGKQASRASREPVQDQTRSRPGLERSTL
ncbi:MAG: hypothetical protein ACRDF5_03105 [bacterium]